MIEFFRSLRRKLGAAILLLACAFMIGLVRTYADTDNTDYVSRTFNQKTATLFSTEGSIGCILTNHIDRQVANVAPHFGSTARCVACVSSGYTLSWSVLGFVIMTSPIEFLIMVPYWSIVIPLTLLSAWLLLSKPRKSNQDRAAEAIPQMVA